MSGVGRGWQEVVNRRFYRYVCVSECVQRHEMQKRSELEAFIAVEAAWNEMKWNEMA